MAKFVELSEQDRIQYVKDNVILILEQLAKDPGKLSTYIKLEKPKLTAAALENIKDDMSDDQKRLIEERNASLKKRVDEENAKLEAAYAAKEAVFKKIEDVISKLQKKEGCLCGSCINVDITNTVLPPEFDLLIDAARKEAEERYY